MDGIHFLLEKGMDGTNCFLLGERHGSFFPFGERHQIKKLFVAMVLVSIEIKVGKTGARSSPGIFLIRSGFAAD